MGRAVRRVFSEEVEAAMNQVRTGGRSNPAGGKGRRQSHSWHDLETGRPVWLGWSEQEKKHRENGWKGDRGRIWELHQQFSQAY